MANHEHVELVRRGQKAIDEWRIEHDRAWFDLSGADLSGEDLSRCILRGADFTGTNLRGANLYGTDLSESEMRGANLSGAVLAFADLSMNDMVAANLCGADLCVVNFHECDLQQTDFAKAKFGRTLLSSVDLSEALGLAEIDHIGPSCIGLDSLLLSKGRLPDEFLRGCGFVPWTIEISRLCNPKLSAVDISEHVSTKLFDARTAGSAFLGGVFISYSHVNAKFVDKLYGKLSSGGASAWLDRHDLVAGPIAKQLVKAIRHQDSAVLVLSKDSMLSDWCWHEIQEARRKEKAESRDVLCPISLDDAWRKPDEFGDQVKFMVESHRVEIDFIRQKNILDFSNPRKFDEQLQKLVKGLKIYYAAPR